MEEFLDDKGAFYNGIESDDSDNGDENYRNYNENWRANVLQNKCFEKFRKFHRKTPVFEFLFNRELYNLIKNRL